MHIFHKWILKDFFYIKFAFSPDTEIIAVHGYECEKCKKKKAAFCDTIFGKFTHLPAAQRWAMRWEGIMPKIQQNNIVKLNVVKNNER